MKRRVLIFGIVSVLLPLIVTAAVTKKDYERAEQFLPGNVDKLVSRMVVTPHWLENSSRFWYVNKLKNDTREYILVDPKRKRRGRLFDHHKLAEALSRAAGKPVSHDKLMLEGIEFVGKRKKILGFRLDGQYYECNLKNYQLKKIDKTKKKHKHGLSPDGKWQVFVKDHNLYLRSTQSSAERQLTTGGEKLYNYAVPLPSAKTMIKQGTMSVKQEVDVEWSPDSKRFITYRIDRRKAGRMHLVQSVPPDGGRPRLYTFAYPLPGEIDLPKAELLIFSIDENVKKPIKVDNPRLPLLYYGDPLWFREFGDNNTFYFVQFERGFGKAEMRAVDMTTGKTRTVMEDTSDTCVDPNIWETRLLYANKKDKKSKKVKKSKKSREIIWSSERSGWNHLYRYDGVTGKLLNAVTKGSWLVRYIVHVDEKRGRIYFMGAGKEKGRNPYYTFLYRVNLDGSGLRLLTPENATHTARFSPDGRYFIDNYSRVDTPPVTVLRRSSDGKVVKILEKADVSRLKAKGWTHPEAFKCKARDGKTDIYGVVYRPTNFDPSKRYPVIDKIYTGPHSFFAPKSYWGYRSMAQSIAELGFIVVEVDGMGTGKRSKAFHNVSYKNLGDGGIDDHIAAFRYLKKRYPYMDLERVGIFGFSAGGYDTVHAMLTHPDFYKVGVAASGNHDHRMDKAWWNELWMDYPVKEHYKEQSNLTNAHKLKGKLLLAHGDLDENVNPSCTIQLVDALIKANKDFDLLIIPNKGHYLNSDAYFVRKRWDFFVRHLLGVEPPKAYHITSLEAR